MKLRELKIFKAVCETKNMSKAAKNLYMTQPAISQTISELEDKLGVKLFERLNKKLILTHPGEILLKNSKKILILINETQSNIENIANMKQGKLRIGASMTIGTYLLPKVIKQFNQQYPQVKTKFIIDNTSVIEKMILDNKIDIGLIEGPIKTTDITIQHLFDNQLYLICSKEHRWSQRRVIAPEEIKDENFILREKGSGTREVIEKNMLKHNLSYHPTHILNNIEAIKKAIKANLGISILPKITVIDDLKAGNLIKLDIKKVKFKRKFNIIHHKDKYKSELFKQFINHLKNN